MLRHLKIFFLSLFAGISLAGATLPEAVEFREDGTFRVGPASFEIQHFNAGWKACSSLSWKERKSTLTPEGLELNAVISAPLVSGKAQETITPVAPDTFRLQSRCEFPGGAELKALHGLITLPANSGCRITADGKAVELPARPQEKIAVFQGKVKKVEFHFPDGRELAVTGEIMLRIQDDRSFQIPTFSFRFAFTPDRGRVSEAKLDLTFHLTLPVSTPVTLSAAANRGFADDPAAGVRGWTAQGPANDLRAFEFGTVKAAGLEFHVPDPAANGGRGVIAVAAGNKFQNIEPSRSLILPEMEAGALNLLHASAWTPAENGKPVGELEVTYADNSTERIPVLSGIDCGNWWSPYHCPNAGIAWRSRNPESYIGLYASSFPLKRNDPRRVVFHAAPEVMWLIAGVSLSDRPVAIPAPGRSTAAAGGDWVGLDFQRKSVSGNPFDFSRYNDAPAGKYGAVKIAPDGTFYFENTPGKRVRFFGPNLVHSGNFLNRETVDRLAGYLVYMGYNAVRFHHIDRQILDKKAPDSLIFDPAELDRLDYLFAKMKEHGIYITIDLYSNRIIRRGDGITEYQSVMDNPDAFKMLLPFSPALMDNWKEYARRLLTHKNSYTGLSWGEDPALFTIVLTNEEVNLHKMNSHPEVQEIYSRNFAVYLKGKGLPDSAPNLDNPAFYEYLHELQGRVLDEQIRFIKEELKLPVPVSSLNHVGNRMSLTRIRDKFDVVTMNNYWDHPTFPEKAFALPMRFNQQSAISDMAGVPGFIMPARIPGKPLIMTEYNFCKPNAFRAEAGPLMGAYAALQNWDGLNRFAWASRKERVEKVEHGFSWDAVNEPLDQLSERITRMMFLRGDVAPAPETVVYPVPEKPFGKREISLFPYNFRYLGLITGIGSAPQEKKLPANAVSAPGASLRAAWDKATSDGIAESATGELRLDANKRTLMVNSPKTVSATLPGGDLTAGILSVRNADTFQTIAAVSLDEKPLRESASILLFHLTDVTNTGMITNGDKTMLYDWGKWPMLLRRGTAEVSLRCNAPLQVTALNADGEAKGEVKAVYQNGILHFKADTTLFPGGIMAYHLIPKK